ncbi:hypothetical protein [Humitalea rosea]|nr:hypothetical protein [Humitalea rosea]
MTSTTPASAAETLIKLPAYSSDGAAITPILSIVPRTPPAVPKA